MVYHRVYTMFVQHHSVTYTLSNFFLDSLMPCQLRVELTVSI